MTNSLSPDFCGLLSDYGLIKISGMDSEKFLQGQLTCDVREVTEQSSRLGAHCDPKGRIQFTFRLCKFHDDYYLRVLKNLVDHTLTLLKKYAVFFKATLEDVSDEWCLFGLAGCREKYFTSVKMPEEIDGGAAFQDGVIIRVLDSIPRFEIMTQKNSSLLKDICSSFSLEAVNHWNLREIISGVPTVYPETVGHFTPQQINYQLINGVSFKKGCYTGQEIIARLQYLGKLKQSMRRVQLKTTNIILPGTKVREGAEQEVGEIVQVAISGSYQEALAVLDDNAVGKMLRADDAEVKV
jgi:folate-binding protein YgfZ